MTMERWEGGTTIPGSGEGAGDLDYQRANAVARARELEEAKRHVEYDPTNPTWMYRMQGGKIESRIFPADDIPEDWFDSPVKAGG